MTLFSTKYLDATGLYYYGHRYYSPSMGRWLNRDSVHELGSMRIRKSKEIKIEEEHALYAIVRNSPITKVDNLGLNAAWGQWEKQVACSRDYSDYYLNTGDDLQPPFPEVPPAPEGFYRHCVRNCEMVRKHLGNPLWECMVYLLAMGKGHDWPRSQHRDPEDLWSNRIGQEVAWLDGSCKELCAEVHPSNPDSPFALPVPRF